MIRAATVAASCRGTADQNLALLVAEVGVWSKPPALPADALADRLAALLVWSYGMNHMVVIEPENKMPPPTLTLGKDGSGLLVFYTNYRQPGPGGAGGGPVYYSETKVVLTADHGATLTKTPGKSR